ncbi:Uncharacterised protein [uncultured archaeon]|nr:Uncharacterised protein [uncultured archaeon]
MRRLLVLLVGLCAVSFVYAQACGDGTLNPGEECDLPGHDDACPGYCDNSSCTCMKEAQEVLFDLYSGHNLLFSKVQDLAHMSKDQAFQDELKVIQYGLRQAYLIPPNNNSCQVVPAMFMLTAAYSPYGKENEIDALNNDLLFKLRNVVLRGNLGVSDTQYNESVLIQDIADQSLAGLNFSVSGSAKCCAYNQLIEPSVLGFSVGNRTCNVQPICGNGIIEFPEQCDDGNIVSGDGCNERCLLEFCGDSIIQPALNETCDPPDGGITCNSTCGFSNAVCPNASVDPGEQCDPDGALPLNDPTCPVLANGSRICGITCHCFGCGNGVIDPGEQCDDGGICSDNNASCTTLNKTSCLSLNATCIVVSGDGCNASCQSEFCGDNVTQGGPPRFEECDPPNGVNCDKSCHNPWCGDGVVQAWETCDPPGASGTCASGTCDVGCQCQSCGNGILEDAEECEVGIGCNVGFSCTSLCQCHVCGDGRIDPGEQCGEPGLTCPAGQTCSNCLCSGGGTTGGGGGGSNKQLQYGVGCCRAFDYLAGSLSAEYSCCGGQDLIGPAGSRIDCCADPELPQCRPYCTLMSCSPPYALDLATQKCVMTSKTAQTGAAPDVQKPAEQTQCTAGYVVKDGKCVAQEVKKPVSKGVITKALRTGSIFNIVTGVLILVAIALVAYMLATRKQTVRVPKFEKVESTKSPVADLDKMKSELDDLEESYDKLDKVIKSMKGGKF